MVPRLYVACIEPFVGFPPPLLSLFLKTRVYKGDLYKLSSTTRRKMQVYTYIPSEWSAPTVIRVGHSRRLAFVPLSWYRPDTDDLDSLAEEIYPTFDSRSFARLLVRSFVRSFVTNDETGPETNR